MINDIKQYFHGVNAPDTTFDLENGVFEMSGKSVCEVAESFYKPIYDTLQTYKSQPKDTTKFTFNLEYFNTSSAKWILKLFYIMDEIHENGKEVNVIWQYQEDDEDVFEAGKDFQEMVQFNVTFEEVE